MEMHLATLAEVDCTCTGDRRGALAEIFDSMLKAALAPREAPLALAPPAPALAPPAKAPATCNVQSQKAIKKVRRVVWDKAKKQKKKVKEKSKEKAEKKKAREAATTPRIHRATVPLALETDPLRCILQGLLS